MSTHRTMSVLVLMIAASNALVYHQPLNSKAMLRRSLSARAELTQKEKEEQYWQGEWVCADCGYIYDRKLFGGRYFEEQTFGFKCPQCSGPRRRYAKKIGDTVGVTLDGGDGPILFWSGVGFLVTIAFGFWASNDFPGIP